MKKLLLATLIAVPLVLTACTSVYEVVTVEHYLPNGEVNVYYALERSVGETENDTIYVGTLNGIEVEVEGTVIVKEIGEFTLDADEDPTRHAKEIVKAYKEAKN